MKHNKIHITICFRTSLNINIVIRVDKGGTSGFEVIWGKSTLFNYNLCCLYHFSVYFHLCFWPNGVFEALTYYVMGVVVLYTCVELHHWLDCLVSDSLFYRRPLAESVTNSIFNQIWSCADIDCFDGVPPLLCRTWRQRGEDRKGSPFTSISDTSRGGFIRITHTHTHMSVLTHTCAHNWLCMRT